jgi:hypothetical protein
MHGNSTRGQRTRKSFAALHRPPCVAVLSEKQPGLKLADPSFQCRLSTRINTIRGFWVGNFNGIGAVAPVVLYWSGEARQQAHQQAQGVARGDGMFAACPVRVHSGAQTEAQPGFSLGLNSKSAWCLASLSIGPSPIVWLLRLIHSNLSGTSKSHGVTEGKVLRFEGDRTQEPGRRDQTLAVS